MYIDINVNLKYLFQVSDVELDYDGSDEESEPSSASVCNEDDSNCPAYEATMKMKYTGHRNAR